MIHLLLLVVMYVLITNRCNDLKTLVLKGQLEFTQASHTTHNSSMNLNQRQEAAKTARTLPKWADLAYDQENE